jgi:flagellin
MALTVATNTGALMAQAAASSVNKEMEISMERLSTGKRINSASDDAAGVAIASRLTSEIRGTNQAIRNAMDGQALIDTAEGAHEEVTNILQRMREIAVQAANDTNSTADRTSLQLEMTALTTEIDRIAASTKWAGKSLLDGATPYDGSSVTALATAHATDQASFTLQIGSGVTAKDTIVATINATSASALGVGGTSSNPVYTNETVTSDGSTSSDTTISTSGSTITIGGTASDGDAAVSISVDGVTVTADFDNDAFEDTAAGNSALLAQALKDGLSAAYTVTDNGDGTVDVTKGGSVSVASQSAAATAIGNIDDAIVLVNAQRASLGAISNRLDSTVSNLTNISANLQAGRGRIEDADFAAETTSLAKSQILQQASTAMLAQANASKQNVLSLLQG